MAFCFVVGTKISSSFEVEGRAESSISRLKEIIYEKKKNNFTSKGFDPSDLELWKVKIPVDAEYIKKLRPLESRHDINDENIIIKNLGGKQLTPFDDFGDIFAYSDLKNVRIIVQPPPPATTGKCLPMVYLSNNVISHHIIFYLIREKENRRVGRGK
jgi:hypothetical protein